jgi:hypothetical protein
MSPPGRGNRLPNLEAENRAENPDTNCALSQSTANCSSLKEFGVVGSAWRAEGAGWHAPFSGPSWKRPQKLDFTDALVESNTPRPMPT